MAVDQPENQADAAGFQSHLYDNGDAVMECSPFLQRFLGVEEIVPLIAGFVVVGLFTAWGITWLFIGGRGAVRWLRRA